MTQSVPSGHFDPGGTPVGRRERRPVSMRGHLATDDGRTGEVLVLDLSYDGCGIESATALTPGETVSLTVSERPAIRADVRWWADGRGGLVFGKDPPAGGESPRAEERAPMNLQASLRRLGLAAYKVTVTDLSPNGCKVEVVERPRVGEHVLLRFQGMDSIESEVCWVKDHEAGLTFERPIHAAVYDLLVRRLQSLS